MKDDNIEFVDNFDFKKYEIPVHIKDNEFRYWIVICKSPIDNKKYDRIIRIEVHIGECCNLFTHSRLLDIVKNIKELNHHRYFDIVKKALLSDAQFDNLKLLDSDYCTMDYFNEKMYLPWYKRIFTKEGL